MTEITYTLFCKDGVKRSRIDPHSNGPLARRFFHTPKRFVTKDGHPMVRLGYPGGEDGAYSLEGRTYRYHYRLMRNLFRIKYVGYERMWKEGNPTPIDLNDEKWKSALDDTAFMVLDIADSDAPVRLLRRKHVDWVTIILASMMTLGIGLALGQYIGVHG